MINSKKTFLKKFMHQRGTKKGTWNLVLTRKLVTWKDLKTLHCLSKLTKPRIPNQPPESIFLVAPYVAKRSLIILSPMFYLRIFFVRTLFMAPKEAANLKGVPAKDNHYKIGKLWAFFFSARFWLDRRIPIRRSDTNFCRVLARKLSCVSASSNIKTNRLFYRNKGYLWHLFTEDNKFIKNYQFHYKMTLLILVL